MIGAGSTRALEARGTKLSQLRAGRRCTSRGSALVEFAFLLPLLFAMVFGIIDFGRALYCYHFVSNAAREATRWASVRGSDCKDYPTCNAGQPEISDYVGSIAPTGIDTSRLTVNAMWPPHSNNPSICLVSEKHPGCPVQVQVNYQFRFVLPFLPSSGITMTSTSEMIISQ
jgi:Flp pilus assembly protein TadG